MINDSLYYYRLNNNGLSRSISRGKNPKTLDHLYLMEMIIRQQQSKNYCMGRYLSATNIHELTAMLWQRTRRLVPKIKKDSFEKLSIISRKNNYLLDWVPLFERIAFKGILKDNYCLWYCFSALASIKKRLLHE